MKVKSFFSKNWIHFVVIAFILILAAMYFKPQLQGYGLKQHDVEQWMGASHETDAYRAKTGEEPLWTNSLFGGMPTTQISVLYSGNLIKTFSNYYFKAFPAPIGYLILHLIGFYILCLFLRINPIIGVIGAVAFSFATYEIVIIQAGHLTKSMATAFMAPILGAFIYSYRTKSMWGLAFASLFMALELAMNHVQVTYYLIFVLVAVGIYYLVKAIRGKDLMPFFKTTIGLIAAFVLAFIINIGNILLTADYAKHTIRGGNDVTIAPDGSLVKNQSAGLDKDYITNWSYGIGESFTFISPNVKGGGHFSIGGSQFQDILDKSDLTISEQKEVAKYPSYWGEQPYVVGPIYMGAVVFLLALLALFFVKKRIKWALFGVTVLAIMLSWGKNFMGLTDLFIDFVPGYNKFRTVTIILVIVELCLPVLGMLFLHELTKEREALKENKKKFLMVIGGFVFLLIVINFTGLGDNYASTAEREQIATIDDNIREQLAQADPQMLQSQYGLDMANPSQVDEFVSQQTEPYYKTFENVKETRESIFHASMLRTILLIFFAGGLILLFVYTSMPSILLMLGILILTMIDLIPVAYQYLGHQEEGTKMKYWVEEGIARYPISSNAADEQILNTELMQNPSLQSIIDKAEQEGKAKAESLGYEGTAKRNVIDSYKYSALNFATDYRVFDLNGQFSSNRASYFHKSLGGYHGAKLRNINNLYDFHLSKMNNKVFDMLNVKYFIQKNEQGVFARPVQTAMGNAWLVQRIEQYNLPNDEIRALGNTFLIENKGDGQFLVNYEPQKEATIYGAEKLQYLLQGKDTITVPLSNGLTEGMEAMFVMDANGNTNLVPMATLEQDTAQSFMPLVSLKVINEFKPREEAVMLTSEAAKLSANKFSGEGTIELKSYAPNRLEYTAKVKGKQLAVFSEIYYPDGWKAFVDGKETEILKVNYLLRGLELSDGDHKIEFVYDNKKFHLANTIALIGSILLILAFAFLIYRRVKRNAGE